MVRVTIPFMYIVHVYELCIENNTNILYIFSIYTLLYLNQGNYEYIQ